jgi:hypothetical protein
VPGQQLGPFHTIFLDPPNASQRQQATHSVLTVQGFSQQASGRDGHKNGQQVHKQARPRGAEDFDAGHQTDPMHSWLREHVQRHLYEPTRHRYLYKK